MYRQKDPLQAAMEEHSQALSQAFINSAYASPYNNNYNSSNKSLLQIAMEQNSPALSQAFINSAYASPYNNSYNSSTSYTPSYNSYNSSTSYTPSYNSHNSSTSYTSPYHNYNSSNYANLRQPNAADMQKLDSFVRNMDRKPYYAAMDEIQSALSILDNPADFTRDQLTEMLGNHGIVP